MTAEEIIQIADAEFKTMSELVHRLGMATVDAEWAYFQEYARNFKENTPDKRYGILIMDQPPKDENMIYDSCPRKLRIKHLQVLSILGSGSDGEKQRRFLDWLERMEGKQ